MFTGLVEEIGFVQSITPQNKSKRITISAKKICRDSSPGDSIAVNGVCLTATDVKDSEFTTQAVEETLNRTTLENLKSGDAVNLERALKIGERLGGHFVQGHVDGMAEVLYTEQRPPGLWLSLQIPSELERFCVEKGSVALEGISLTIAEIRNNVVSVAVVPKTAQSTTLSGKRSGDFINIEVDILGKYVDKMLRNLKPETNITMQKLNKLGF